MFKARRIELLESLRLKTNDGSLKWKETAEEGVFQISYPKYSVQISDGPSTMPSAGSDAVDYVIKIYNQEGNIADQFRDWEVATDNSYEAYKVMGHIYDQARARAMGLDDVYGYLIDEINDDLPF